MSEVLNRPVRYEQQPTDRYAATLSGYALGKPLLPGVVDVKRAKDKDLDSDESRTAQTTSPTTFRRGCEEALEPAVLG